MKSGALREYSRGLAGRRIFWARSAHAQLQNQAKYCFFRQISKARFLGDRLSALDHFVQFWVSFRRSVAVLTFAVLDCRHFDHRPSVRSCGLAVGLTKYHKGPQRTAKDHNKDRKGPQRSA